MTEPPRSVDAVVVGSGPGGSTLAYGLSRRGGRVLVVEQGDFVRPDPRRVGETSIYYGYLPHNAEQCVGGQSKVFGAALYRLREADFEAFATECGESPAWPIHYHDLEPFYSAAEQMYGVRGSTDGDPTEPFHSVSYPHAPVLHEPYIAAVVDRIRAQGIPVSYIPKGVDFGPGGRCVLCQRCDAHYCQLDAKMDAEIAALRPALATGNVELLTNTECLRVLTSPDGRRSTGVVLSSGGQQFTVHAGLVAVAAGVRQSPRLLHRSRNPAHPIGIGNAAGCLGRYLGGHSAGWLLATRGRKLPPMHQKTFAINTFYGPSTEWPYPTGVIQAAGQIPVWLSAPRWVAPGLQAFLERCLACLLMTEAIPSRESGLHFDHPTTDGWSAAPMHSERTFRHLRRLAATIFRRAGFRVWARQRPTALFHPVGTARFGDDPAHSVLDPTCQVHGVEGLYVVDSAALPSAGAVNTTLTVVALALRSAAIIAGERLPVSANAPGSMRAVHEQSASSDP